MRGNSVRVRVNVAATTLGGGSTPGAPPRGGPTSSSTGSRPAWPSPWTSSTGPVSTQQVVTSRPEMCRPKDVDTKMEMIIYCDNLNCNFFNSVKFQVKEDEEEGLRHNTNQALGSFPSCVRYSRNLELFCFCHSYWNRSELPKPSPSCVIPCRKYQSVANMILFRCLKCESVWA